MKLKNKRGVAVGKVVKYCTELCIHVTVTTSENAGTFPSQTLTIPRREHLQLRYEGTWARGIVFSGK